MEGFRTFIIAAFVAAVPTLTTAMAGVDWVALLTNMGVPQVAIVPLISVIGGALMGGMRAITTTPPGQKP